MPPKKSSLSSKKYRNSKCRQKLPAEKEGLLLNELDVSARALGYCYNDSSHDDRIYILCDTRKNPCKSVHVQHDSVTVTYYQQPVTLFTLPPVITTQVAEAVLTQVSKSRHCMGHYDAKFDALTNLEHPFVRRDGIVFHKDCHHLILTDDRERCDPCFSSRTALRCRLNRVLNR